MKIKAPLAFILTTLLSFSLDAQSLLQLRNMYYKASVNSHDADFFYKALNTVNEKSPAIMQAYKGMAALMICSHSINPYTKIKYFNEGKTFLERAIKLEPDNTELRYLRFSVQSNVPSFLGYKTNLTDDKTVILNKLQDTAFKITDPDMFNRITSYLLETNAVTKEDKMKVKDYMND